MMMNSEIKVLLAEDDENLGRLLSDYLEKKDFSVSLARNGREAYNFFINSSFSICILDVMMPEMDGIELANEIREVDKKIPILFLTAKGQKEDKLKGFEAGADDYITKPFSMEELLARMKAVLKRVEPKSQNKNPHFMIGNIKYEPELRLLHLQKDKKKLTTKENDLLNLLVKNENIVLDRQATLRAVWGDDNYFNGRSMDVYIAKLRKMLSEDENIEIMNIHGKGFKLLIK